MAVAPVELMQAWPVLAGILAVSVLAGLPFSTGYGARFFSFFVPMTGGVLLAVFGFPALLPFLPFRAFALKGAVLGCAWAVASAAVLGASAAAGAGLVLLIAPIAAIHCHELHRLVDIHQPARGRPGTPAGHRAHGGLARHRHRPQCSEPRLHHIGAQQ